ncbi:MAG: hypothetical protein H7144_12125 [Burkholderiales bacterium]|nr:hypothetical protein [Phycisphaerae bacterium]
MDQPPSNIPAPITPAPVPTVSPALIRQLPMAVAATVFAVALVIAIIIVVTPQPQWWPAFIGATVVAAVAMIASVAILLSSAGKPADYVITMTMLLAGVRVGVSLIGLIVCIMAFSITPVAVAMMICGYYVATLIVESTLVSRALRAQVPGAQATSPNETIRGKQG